MGRYCDVLLEINEIKETPEKLNNEVRTRGSPFICTVLYLCLNFMQTKMNKD